MILDTSICDFGDDFHYSGDLDVTVNDSTCVAWLPSYAQQNIDVLRNDTHHFKMHFYFEGKIDLTIKHGVSDWKTRVLIRS